MMYRRRQHEVAKTRGDRHAVAHAIAGIANIFLASRDYTQAIRFFDQCVEEFRSLYDPDCLADALEGTAEALLMMRIMGAPDEDAEARTASGLQNTRTDSELPEYYEGLARVRALAIESTAIERDRADGMTRLSRNILLARIDAAEGRLSTGADNLMEMLRTSHEAEAGAQLHYWLWVFLGREEDRDAAHDAFEALVQRVPKHLYRARIEELRANVRPPFQPASAVEPSAA